MLSRTPKWKPFVENPFQLSDTPVWNPLSCDNIDGRKQLRNENPFRTIIVQETNLNLKVLMITETKIDEAFPES